MKKKVTPKPKKDNKQIIEIHVYVHNQCNAVLTNPYPNPYRQTQPTITGPYTGPYPASTCGGR